MLTYIFVILITFMIFCGSVVTWVGRNRMLVSWFTVFSTKRPRPLQPGLVDGAIIWATEDDIHYTDLYEWWIDRSIHRSIHRSDFFRLIHIEDRPHGILSLTAGWENFLKIQRDERVILENTVLGIIIIAPDASILVQNAPKLLVAAAPPQTLLGELTALLLFWGWLQAWCRGRLQRIIGGLESYSYSDRLRILGLTTLEVRFLKTDLIEVFKILGGFKNADPESERFFQVVGIYYYFLIEYCLMTI